MKTVILKPGREESLRRLHPWIFSGAVAAAPEALQPGETVRICGHDGAELALAAWSPRSQIRARVWTFDTAETIDESWLRERIDTAIRSRETLLPPGKASGAVRLVYSEADGLPGLIVDRYADYIVCQILSAGMERWRRAVVAALAHRFGCRSVFERSDVAVRQREGLEPRSGLLWGEEPPARLAITEGPCHYWVDVRRGHKTGFYLDQRDNRAKLATRAHGKSLLNCFSYSGAFAIAALVNGAHRATNVDSSRGALSLAADNATLNDLDPSRLDYVEGNVFETLRSMRREQRRFDIVVLDPPKFIDSRVQLRRGARAYKDLNMNALKLLEPGGLLYTFSCSGQLDAALFQKIVADAALDAGRRGQISERLGQSADHPIALNFPEGDYLKGLCVRLAD